MRVEWGYWKQQRGVHAVLLGAGCDNASIRCSCSLGWSLRFEDTCWVHRHNLLHVALSMAFLSGWPVVQDAESTLMWWFAYTGVCRGPGQCLGGSMSLMQRCWVQPVALHAAGVHGCFVE
jgi:hypothetical protein